MIIKGRWQRLEKKQRRKPFILKRSIGARILLAIFVLFAAVMITIHFTLWDLATQQVSEYYRDTGDLIASLLLEQLDDTPDDFDGYMASGNAQTLAEMCKSFGVYSIWMETSEPPYETGINRIYLTPHSEFGYMTKPSGEEFPLGEEEKEIFRGEKQEAMYEFESDHRIPLIACLFGVFSGTRGECEYIISVNYEAKTISDDVSRSVWKMYGIIIALFVGMTLFIGIFLHRAIFEPLLNISRKMRDYITGNQLNADTLPVQGEDELSRVAEAYNTMTGEISNYIRRVETLETERLTNEAEMNVAAQIQAGMLPPGAYRNGQIRIRALMKPAREIAGDFYDYQIMPDGRAFLVIADVSGKGVSAALFMAEAVNAIRYNAAYYSSPAQILHAANNDLCARNPEMLFVTAYAAVYDPAGGVLTYCNAGHNPIYRIGAGRADTLKDADCILLGLFPEEEYTDAQVRIDPGDIIFFYTDGLTETFDPGRSFFGQNRLEEELHRYGCGDPEEELTEQMYTAVKSFANGAEAHDDLTMMAVRFGREIVIEADTEDSGRLRQFLLAEEVLSASDRKKICLAAEEIFVNICRYAYESGAQGIVRVSTLMTGGHFTMRFLDHGMPYDPLQDIQGKEEYDPDLQLGGLGKLMAFTIMDQQEYEYRDGCNILTLTKTIKD